MRNCPTDIQIALFADGRLSALDTKEMCQHIATCQECSHLLIDVLSINDMHATGLLAAPPKEDINRSTDAVHNILSTAKPEPPSLKDRINNFYGIFS
jgi:anti-sigma factor RsiW